LKKFNRFKKTAQALSSNIINFMPRSYTHTKKRSAHTENLPLPQSSSSSSSNKRLKLIEKRDSILF